jgi:bacterioferritin
MKGKNIDETIHTLIDRLNQALRLEYTLIIHYPYISNFIKDEEVKKLIGELGSASVHHADVVATIISKLGGKPDWSFEPPPTSVDLKQLFLTQLVKERMALQLHKGSAEMMAASPNRDALHALAKEEEDHIQIVEQILSILNKT